MGRVISHVSAEFLLLLGLLAFVGLSFGAQTLLPLDSRQSLPWLSALSLALMPTLLWLGFLSLDCPRCQRRQADGSPLRISPVLSALLLGALLAGPLANQLIGFSTRFTSGGLAVLLMNGWQWVYALTIVGIAHESCKFAIAEICLGQTSRLLTTSKRSARDLRRHKLALYTAVAIGFAGYLSYLELRSGQAISLSTASLLVSERVLFHILLASLLCIATSAAGQLLGDRYRASIRYGLHVVLITTALVAAASANALLAMVSDSLNRAYSIGLITLLFLLIHGLAIRFSQHQSCDKEPIDQSPNEPPIRTRAPLLVTLAAVCVCLSLYTTAHYRVHHLASKALQWASQEGLRFQYPAKWQALGEFPLARSALASTIRGVQTPPNTPGPRWSARFAEHIDASNFIEVEIIPSPRYPNLSGFLAIKRLSRYGEEYREFSASKVTMGTEPTLWLRTIFEYHRQDFDGQSLASIHAIEYAAAKYGHLYIVTLHVRGVQSPALDTALRYSLNVEKATR